MNFFNSQYWRERISYLSDGWLPYGTLLLFCALLFLPGIFTLPAVDHAEGLRLANIQQLHSQPELPQRQHKPDAPLSLITATLSITGIQPVWSYRLLSFCALVLCVFSVFIAGTELFNPPKALLASILSAASLSVTFITPQLLEVSLLCAFCAATLSLVSKIYLTSHRDSPEDIHPLQSYLLFAAITITILTTGWIVVIPVTGAILCLLIKDKSAFKLYPILLPTAIAIASCALILITLHYTTSLNLAVFFMPRSDVFTLASRPWQHPALYIATAFTLLFPLTYFALPALTLTLRTRMRQNLICLGWLALPLLLIPVFEQNTITLCALSSAPLALLCADFIMSPVRVSFNKVLKFICWIIAIASLFIPITFFTSATLMQHKLGYAITTLHICVFLILILAYTGSGIFLLRGARLRLLLLSALTSLILAASLNTFVLPYTAPIWPGKTIAQTFNKIKDEEDSTGIILLRANIPSLIYYANTKVETFPETNTAAQQLIFNPQHVLITTQTDKNKVISLMKNWGLEVEEIATTQIYDFKTLEVKELYFLQRSISPSAEPHRYEQDNY